MGRLCFLSREGAVAEQGGRQPAASAYFASDASFLTSLVARWETNCFFGHWFLEDRTKSTWLRQTAVGPRSSRAEESLRD